MWTRSLGVLTVCQLLVAAFVATGIFWFGVVFWSRQWPRVRSEKNKKNEKSMDESIRSLIKLIFQNEIWMNCFNCTYRALWSGSNDSCRSDTRSIWMPSFDSVSMPPGGDGHDVSNESIIRFIESRQSTHLIYIFFAPIAHVKWTNRKFIYTNYIIMKLYYCEGVFMNICTFYPVTYQRKKIILQYFATCVDYPKENYYRIKWMSINKRCNCPVLCWFSFVYFFD